MIAWRAASPSTMATFDHEYCEQERQLLKLTDDEFRDKPELQARVIRCISLARQIKKLKQMESEVKSNRPVVKLLLPRNISFIAAAKAGIMDGAFMYAADQVATLSLGDWKGTMLVLGSFFSQYWFYDPTNPGNHFNHMISRCMFIALNSPYFYSFGGLNLSVAVAGFVDNILWRTNAYLHDLPVGGDSSCLILRDSMVLCLYVLVPTVLPAPLQRSYWPLPRYITESIRKVNFAPCALSLLFEIGILFGTIYRYLHCLVMYQLPRLFHLAWVIVLVSLQWVSIEFQRVATHFSKPKDSLKYEAIDKSTDQIRLLVLQPKTRFGLVKCNLESRSLDSAGSFEAISYRWSDNGQPMAILVGRQRKIVSNTVYLLLRSLQSDSKRVLWLDSICINQDDKEEKEWQIPLMRKVYSLATRVIGWVGDSPASAGALRYLSQLPAALNSKSKSRTDKIWHARENHRFKDSFNRNWSAVESLLEHTWFSRVWVMQGKNFI
jgi:Heterokaryon incompatibility protein (HET)